MFPQTHPRTVTKNFSLMANGIMDSKGLPFLISVSNFRDRPVRISKGAVIIFALPAPKAVLTVRIPPVQGPGLNPSKDPTPTDRVIVDEPQGWGS